MTRRLPQELREAVRKRAGDRCEYCRKPTTHDVYPPHVDHIIPPMHGGTHDETNLAWACFQCNSAKSAHVASYDPTTKALTALFHPRKHLWTAHFVMHDGQIDGLTPIGRVTVNVLQMNADDQIEVRQRMIRRGDWEKT